MVLLAVPGPTLPSNRKKTRGPSFPCGPLALPKAEVTSSNSGVGCASFFFLIFSSGLSAPRAENFPAPGVIRVSKRLWWKIVARKCQNPSVNPPLSTVLAWTTVGRFVAAIFTFSRRCNRPTGSCVQESRPLLLLLRDERQQCIDPRHLSPVDGYSSAWIHSPGTGKVGAADHQGAAADLRQRYVQVAQKSANAERRFLAALSARLMSLARHPR